MDVKDISDLFKNPMPRPEWMRKDDQRIDTQVQAIQAAHENTLLELLVDYINDAVYCGDPRRRQDIKDGILRDLYPALRQAVRKYHGLDEEASR